MFKKANVQLSPVTRREGWGRRSDGDEIHVESLVERNLGVCESVYVCEDGCVNVNFSQYEYQPNVSK